MKIKWSDFIVHDRLSTVVSLDSDILNSCTMDLGICWENGEGVIPRNQHRHPIMLLDGKRHPIMLLDGMEAIVCGLIQA